MSGWSYIQNRSRAPNYFSYDMCIGCYSISFDFSIGYSYMYIVITLIISLISYIWIDDIDRCIIIVYEIMQCHCLG